MAASFSKDRIAMMEIVPTGRILGATVHGLDLSRPLSEEDFAALLGALGAHGVLKIPGQAIAPAQLKAFSSRFGGLQRTVSSFNEPGLPEVSILSNIVENGKAIGIADAGQDWHTDMSYNRTVGFVNVLHALKVPRRDGRALGSTSFANMHAAYEDLPAEIKLRLAHATALHDFNKFWENMRARPGSERPPLSPEQRAKRPPSVHPVFLTHPITGRKVLYCNPGYALRINELEPADSDEILEFLFAHQLQPKYQYTHEWAEHDVLMWDHIGTLHNAWPDYLPHEHRLIKRCQVLADRIFDPAFLPQPLRQARDAARA
ncbi:Alpha-ketoglutarate-dependent taurine dioxygenase [Pigmentiphaga humi]|uniref:Alpha-ketoglutarate-dependent taurine dioxygenase n=1 Tax=Pigmentiphaga humi TaxID=2478468 RepID=A0A3P4AW46_9BURK|nr:TauD/TfdA family dioxygenase [Pigmentiphaga humi]VCU68247.1 Alpha-ketoglutarate-dependent taurine dioxygenase [Pigmentiphaga humi]